MRSRSTSLVLSAALAVVSLWGSVASAVVVLEDFSEPAVQLKETYEGNVLLDAALVPGWDIGGRYIRIEDVGTDRMMSASKDGGAYSIGTNLTRSGNAYYPAYNAAEAISLANADDLQFGFVNRMPKAGWPVTALNMVMSYYDASAGAVATVKLFGTSGNNGGTWALGEAKTFTVDVDTIANFDKAADKVFGFQFTGSWNRMSSVASSDGPIGWTSLAYTEVPEPATLVLLALGGLSVLRRRSR